MALWAGTAINSNETAMVFNQLYNKKAFAMVRKKNGVAYAILGKMEVGQTPGSSTGFDRLKKITGLKVEVKLLGKLPSPTTCADANQADTATLTIVSDRYGAAEFPIAHYAFTEPVIDSEYRRFKGSESKTLSYIDDKHNELVLGYEKAWGTAFWVTGTSGAPSRTIVGSVPFGIAGNNTTGAQNWASNGSSYGTIDRTDSGNADFRGYYKGSVGDISLKEVRAAKNQVLLNGGMVTLAPCGEPIYTKMQTLIEAFTQVTYDEKWSKFGGEYCKYSGIAYVLDSYAPSGIMPLMEPESWGFWNDDDLTDAGIIRDPSRRATFVIPTSPWVQLLCIQPNHNALLADITV